MSEITIEQIKRTLPKALKERVSEDFLETLNNLTGNEVFREAFRENLLGYADVIKDGRYKTQSYIDAVKYVTYKLLGNSNVAAYSKTFPERYQRLINEGCDDKDISSFVVAYNKNQLVNKIFEQTLIPTHILNADLYQKAINTQADLMLNAKSEKVRSDAANSLLTHLKRPETAKIELDIGYKDDSTINELRAATMALVKQQRELLESGLSTAKEIAHSNIIEGEIIDED